jgi:hypothetical protein
MFPSATFPNPVKRPYIGALVYRLAVYFNPRMSFERDLLCADYHFRGHTVTPEKASGHSGPLQTQNPFWIPYTREVHCVADTIDRVAR